MGKPCPLQTAPSVSSFTVMRLPSWRLYHGVLFSVNLLVADGSLRTITILSTHSRKLKIQQVTNPNLFNTHLMSQVEASPAPTEQNAGIEVCHMACLQALRGRCTKNKLMPCTNLGLFHSVPHYVFTHIPNSEV